MSDCSIRVLGDCSIRVYPMQISSPYLQLPNLQHYNCCCMYTLFVVTNLELPAKLPIAMFNLQADSTSSWLVFKVRINYKYCCMYYVIHICCTGVFLMYGSDKDLDQSLEHFVKILRGAGVNCDMDQYHAIDDGIINWSI